MLLPPAVNVFKQAGIPSREVRLDGMTLCWTCLCLNVLIFVLSSQYLNAQFDGLKKQNVFNETVYVTV
jgi:hypothetical protein